MKLALLHLIFLLILIKTPADCLSNLTDRLALLKLKSNIANDPFNVLTSWNDSVNLCKWQGVTCGRKHNRVTSLDLEGKFLTGTLSPSIKNLTFLRFLNLANNSFHGEIPEEVGSLFRLRFLNLSQNTFQGRIPVKIGNCSNLRIIALSTNILTGKIPAELGSLQHLSMLLLQRNRLTGEIHPSLGNLSSLQYFDLAINNLQGSIPNDFGKLTNLKGIIVCSNNMSGIIPSTFYNLSSIIFFYAGTNRFEGTLPTTIGLTLPYLTEFAFSNNKIHGRIPVSLTNASLLELLDVSENNLIGQVPRNLGYMKSLNRLNIENNSLGNNTSGDLDFLTSLSNCSNLEFLYVDMNNFGGTLSPTIGNLSTRLGVFAIGGNQIFGEIPKEIGNLVNLYQFGMEVNHFSDTIPDSFGKLVNMEFLTLHTNNLSGEIPESFGNMTRIYLLDLSHNSLGGNISTSSVWNLPILQQLSLRHNHLFGSITKQNIAPGSLFRILDVSGNRLTGPLPSEVGNMRSIRELYVLHNKFTGEIPSTIGGCSSLEILEFRNNSLQGAIPSSFVSLRGLQELDLSGNNLSGKIPEGIDKLLFLRYLNVSFNNLEGEVPTKGVFSNKSAVSFYGNKNLCGGIPELQLSTCPSKQKKHGKPATSIIILITTICAGAIFTTVASLWVLYRQRSRKNPSSAPFTFDEIPQVSYKYLLQATKGFSLDNIIGEGTFGSVYKGNLNLREGMLVAVKVLKLEQHGASKSFLSGCKSLCNVRHRNLVKLLTYCSSIDYKGHGFKALVYDFMENGSLEMWLHPREDDGINPTRSLSLVQRLRVAIDVSSALHYLQDNCEAPIVHRDLKPSNILFDTDIVAETTSKLKAKAKKTKRENTKI